MTAASQPSVASPADLSSASLAAELSTLVADPSRVIDTPQVVDRLSRDFYWYSPVLKKLLDGKRGDVVVQPVSAEEVQSVLAYCYKHEIPVTARGSGTGNYGQAVPLHGGVVLDLQRMEASRRTNHSFRRRRCRAPWCEAIGATMAVAQCQPGVRLCPALEAEGGGGAQIHVGNCRCYPSTVW